MYGYGYNPTLTLHLCGIVQEGCWGLGFWAQPTPSSRQLPPGLNPRLCTCLGYRGTSPTRNTPLLGFYRRTIPRVLQWS